MPMQETWISARATPFHAHEHASPEISSMYAYRDADNPGAEIRINFDAIWRVYPDGREEDLSPEDAETWFRRLKADARRAERNRRWGEI